jgi:hypothetical protein
LSFQKKIDDKKCVIIRLDRIIQFCFFLDAGSSPA